MEFGVRQAAISVICWVFAVLIRTLNVEVVQGEVWVLCVVPAYQLGSAYGATGTSVATLITIALTAIVGFFFVHNTSELWAGMAVGAVSFFLGILFRDKRIRETELRDTVRSLRQLVVTDPLTGVYNRRYLLEHLNREVARAKRYKTHLSVMMIDVDGFKGYNDAHGHIAGDVLLRQIAQLIRGELRQEDVVVRYGGDEFAVILTAADAPSAWVVAERVRNTIRSTGLSASLGMVTYPQDALTVEDLLRQADYCLLTAKSGGKDRVYTPRH